LAAEKFPIADSEVPIIDLYFIDPDIPDDIIGGFDCDNIFSVRLSYSVKKKKDNLIF